MNVRFMGDMKSKCPVCKKIIDEAARQDSRIAKFYPFCSNRCKLIDLGKWLDADYKIAAAEEDDKTGEDKNKTSNPNKTENG